MSAQSDAERRGFTLVELVVVIAILGIAAAVVVPAFLNEPTGQPVDVAAARVQGLLTDARREAVRDARDVRVLVDVARARWRVTARGDSGLVIIADTTVDLPAGVSLAASGPAARFDFHLDGTATGDTLRVEGGATALVLTDPLTGEPRVLAR